MKKIKQKRRKHNKIRFFIICVFLIIIISLFFINKLGKRINESLIKISEIESKKITKYVINKSISNYILTDNDLKNIFIMEKDSSGNIQTIDLDSKKINTILNNINSIVNKNLIELERGESSLLELNNDLLSNNRFISNKKGVIFYIPIGLSFNNSFLSNLGPKVPVKIKINGNYESQIKTNIENYGINNALFKVFLNLKVSEQIILPLYSKEVEIDNNVLIAAKMIQGEIPNYFFNDLNKSYTR